jgi:hypothetical protein
METALSGLDLFNLTRTPNFEPRRGPAIPTYVAAAESGLLYLPIKGGPENQVLNWMASVDGVNQDALQTKLSQKDLRQWKRKHPGHRSFTVLRHPVVRAHGAFCKHILGTGPDSYAALRQTLRRRYALPIPEDMLDSSYDRSAHRAAFAEFLVFLKGNLTGQTAIRVDAAWCSQTQALQGFGEFALPDRVIREDDLETEFAQLLATTKHEGDVALGPTGEELPFELSDIYDAEIETLAQDVYQRDYMMFGFENWR